MVYYCIRNEHMFYAQRSGNKIHEIVNSFWQLKGVSLKYDTITLRRDGIVRKRHKGEEKMEKLTKEETRFIELMRLHPENVTFARRVLKQAAPNAGHRPPPDGTNPA